MKRFLILAAVTLAAAGAVAVTATWVPLSSIIATKEVPEEKDPDIPAMLKRAKSAFTKEEFLMKRAEGIALKRGVVRGQPFDPSLRPKAVEQMKKQEDLVAGMPGSALKDNLLLAWNAIGPAPIPNGQTAPTAAVSGRVTAIAIHPTNANIVYVGAAQGGVYRSTDGGTNWTAIFDSAQSLAIGALAIAPSSPNTLYVGTGEPNFSADSFFGVGVYRIDNAPTTATLNGPFGGAQFAGRSVSEIIVHPTDPDTIFAASTSGIGGIRPTSSTFPNRGVYRSTNATGVTPTFTQIGTAALGTNVNVRDLAVDPTDANILLASRVSSSSAVFRSTNALGVTPTFTNVLTLGSGAYSELASQRSGAAANATFYAASSIGGGRIHRSADGGATWTTQDNNGFCGGQCFYDIAIAVDPSNPANVYLGGDPTIISASSTDNGVSFTDNNAGVHVDTHAMEVAPSAPATVYLGTDGGIYKSIDSGATWTPLNNSQFNATQFMSLDVHPTDANFSLGGTQDNGTNWYQPGGTWTRADFGDGGWAVIDQNAPDTTNVRMYHTYFNAPGLQGYGTVASTASASDGMWVFRGCGAGPGNGITCNGVVNFYAPLERGPGNPNTIYYGSDRLYRSADEGVNHTVVSQNPISAGNPISSIGIAPGNDNVRMVGLNNGELWGTSTGSSTLTNLDPTNAIPNVAIARTVVDPLSSTTAYVTLSAFGVTNVWKTTTLSSLASGLAPTWAAAAGAGANVLPQVPVNAIVVDPVIANHVYVGTDIGVYYSPDAGANWFPFGTGLPRVAVFGIALTTPLPRQVRIATHGRGMFQTPAALATTAASATIGGRVLTTNGSGVYRAVVSVTFPNGSRRSATTNQFGYYRFEDIPIGESYVFSAQHKQHQFPTRVVNVDDDMNNLNITASK